MTEKNNWNARW